MSAGSGTLASNRPLPSFNGEQQMIPGIELLVVLVGDLRPAIAAVLHVTPRTLQRALRRCTGFTPAEVIRRTRLQDAAHQLTHQEPASLARVAHAAGYADHAHMSRDFRDVLDRTPSDVRDSD